MKISCGKETHCKGGSREHGAVSVEDGAKVNLITIPLLWQPSNSLGKISYVSSVVLEGLHTPLPFAGSLA